MAEKLFYSMGEVAEMFDVAPSLLRHWESQFDILRPKRNKKGNRLFTPRDVETLKRIYHLVKERGMTLEGAKRALGRTPAAAAAVDRDAELMERLQRIRALLVEVREDLKEGPAAVASAATEIAATFAPDDAPAADDAADAAASVSDAAPEAAPVPPRRGRRAVVRIAEEEPAAPADSEADSEAASTAKSARRRGRRRKDDGGDKELFAFYEQSLF